MFDKSGFQNSYDTTASLFEVSTSFLQEPQQIGFKEIPVWKTIFLNEPVKLVVLVVKYSHPSIQLFLRTNGGVIE